MRPDKQDIEVCAQVKYALGHQIPWAWKVPNGLHTDGHVVYHFALPLAYISGADDIVMFRALGYSATTTRIVHSILMPIATTVLDGAFQFEIMLNRNVRPLPQVKVPPPSEALRQADLLRAALV